VQLTGKEAQVSRLQDQVAGLDARVAELESQVATLQRLGDKRLDVIFHPHRIELGKMSGGFREDDQTSDAGVRVFVRPIDAQGATLKAAGDVKIELFDLAAGPGRQFLGACQYGADQMSKYWMSAGFVNQYAFECRWPGDPPTHPDVTINVTFVDTLPARR
jgi:hypothetical protein